MGHAYGQAAAWQDMARTNLGATNAGVLPPWRGITAGSLGRSRRVSSRRWLARGGLDKALGKVLYLTFERSAFALLRYFGVRAPAEYW